MLQTGLIFRFSQKRVTHAAMIAAAFCCMVYFGTRIMGRLVADGSPEAWESIYLRSVYSRTVISLDFFNDGFVRRGLGGTIANSLSSNWLHGAIAFMALSCVLLAIAVSVILTRLNWSQNFWDCLFLTGVICVSPQTFKGCALDFARTDMLVASGIAFASAAVMFRRSLLALAIILLTSLVHETALIFGAPILAVLLINSCSVRQNAVYDLAIYAVLLTAGTVLIFLAQRYYSAPNAALVERMMRAGPDWVDHSALASKEIATYMFVTGLRGIRTAVCYNLQINQRYFMNTFLALLMIFVYIPILNLTSRFTACLGVAFLPVLFMIAIANDTGRWLQLGVLNLWIYASSLQARGVATPSRRGAYIVRSGLFIAVISIGATRYESINNLSSWLGDALGLQLSDPLAPWLDRCDPDWRAVVSR
ncbi:hypothetical protein [Alsobacter metallidurans]|uniref:hypothetical protein n=1 Tax=Alsobacter metallidurans TaxID=340221 RepID=UPI0016693E96|nr:hypothetical protein [Alsobacter metallidurans]